MTEKPFTLIAIAGGCFLVACIFFYGLGRSHGLKAGFATSLKVIREFK